MPASTGDTGGTNPYTTGGSFGTSGPAPTQGAAPGGPLPDWIVFGGGLLMVSAIAEGIYHLNPKAGYAFAFLVLLGYAASGDRLTKGVDFGKSIGLIK